MSLAQALLLFQSAAAEPVTTGGVVGAVIGAAVSFSGFVWKILREQAKERRETAELHARTVEALEKSRLEERREWKEALNEFSASLQTVIGDNTAAMKMHADLYSAVSVHLQELKAMPQGKNMRRRSGDA